MPPQLTADQQSSLAELIRANRDEAAPSAPPDPEAQKTESLATTVRSVRSSRTRNVRTAAIQQLHQMGLSRGEDGKWVASDSENPFAFSRPHPQTLPLAPGTDPEGEDARRADSVRKQQAKEAGLVIDLPPEAGEQARLLRDVLKKRPERAPGFFQQHSLVRGLEEVAEFGFDDGELYRIREDGSFIFNVDRSSEALQKALDDGVIDQASIREAARANENLRNKLRELADEGLLPAEVKAGLIGVERGVALTGGAILGAKLGSPGGAIGAVAGGAIGAVVASILNDMGLSTIAEKNKTVNEWLGSEVVFPVWSEGGTLLTFGIPAAIGGRRLVKAFKAGTAPQRFALGKRTAGAAGTGVAIDFILRQGLHELGLADEGFTATSGAEMAVLMAMMSGLRVNTRAIGLGRREAAQLMQKFKSGVKLTEAETTVLGKLLDQHTKADTNLRSLMSRRGIRDIKLRTLMEPEAIKLVDIEVGNAAASKAAGLVVEGQPVTSNLNVKPRIHVKSSKAKDVTVGGTKRVRLPDGVLVPRGRILKPDAVPGVIYHVTDKSLDVATTGMLTARAGVGQISPGVSFFSSRAQALDAAKVLRTQKGVSARDVAVVAVPSKSIPKKALVQSTEIAGEIRVHADVPVADSMFIQPTQTFRIKSQPHIAAQIHRAGLAPAPPATAVAPPEGGPTGPLVEGVEITVAQEEGLLVQAGLAKRTRFTQAPPIPADIESLSRASMRRLASMYRVRGTDAQKIERLLDIRQANVTQHEPKGRLAREIKAIEQGWRRFVKKAKGGAAFIDRQFISSLVGGIFAKRAGPYGRQLSQEMMSVSIAGNKGYTRHILGNAVDQMKLVPKKDWPLVWQLMNGAITPAEATPIVRKVMPLVRAEFDVVQRMNAMAQGKRIPTRVGGAAFPQVPNKLGKEIMEEVPRRTTGVMRIINKMMRETPGLTEEQAMAELQTWKRHLDSGFVPYLYGKRVLLPKELVSWDFEKVLLPVQKRSWDSTAAALQWGASKNGTVFPKLDLLLERMADTGHSARARILSRHLRFMFGAESPSENARIPNWLLSFQYETKLNRSPMGWLRNSLDRIPRGLTLGSVNAFAKTVKDLPPFFNTITKQGKRLNRLALEHGTVFTSGGMAEGAEAFTSFDMPLLLNRVPWLRRMLKSAQFSTFEFNNQVFISQIRARMVEEDLKWLLRFREMKPAKARWVAMAKGIRDFNITPRGTMLRRLKEFKLDNISSPEAHKLMEKIAKAEALPEEVQAVLSKVVMDTAFPITLYNAPTWWKSAPWVRPVLQFKIWPMRNLEFAYKFAIREAVFYGNAAPLLKFIIGSTAAGEIWKIGQDAILGTERSVTMSTIFNPNTRNVKDVGTRLMMDALTGGLLGFWWDLTYGIGDWLLGPSFSSAESAVKAAAEVTWATGDPKLALDSLKEAVKREVVPLRQATEIWRLQGPKLSGQETLAADAALWRDRGRRWFNDAKFPALSQKVQKTVVQALQGRANWGTARNTQAYRMASLMIETGRVGEAAEVLAMVLDEAESPRERRILRNNIGNALKSHSPLGFIPKETVRANIQEFRRSMSTEDWVEARGVQRAWIRRAQKSVREAFKISRLRGRPLEQVDLDAILEILRDAEPSVTE